MGIIVPNKRTAGQLVPVRTVRPGNYAGRGSDDMLETITKINSAVNGFVWGPVMLALLVGTGVFLTFRTGWVQVRRFGYIMKNTVGSLFRKSDADHGSNLSPFQAVTTAPAVVWVWVRLTANRHPSPRAAARPLSAR